MTQRMSKTLASEIASRVLAVTSPANRGIALSSTLTRHGFNPGLSKELKHPLEHAALMQWLLANYALTE